MLLWKHYQRNPDTRIFFPPFPLKLYTQIHIFSKYYDMQPSPHPYARSCIRKHTWEILIKLSRKTLFQKKNEDPIFKQCHNQYSLCNLWYHIKLAHRLKSLFQKQCSSHLLIRPLYRFKNALKDSQSLNSCNSQQDQEDLLVLNTSVSTFKTLRVLIRELFQEFFPCPWGQCSEPE